MEPSHTPHFAPVPVPVRVLEEKHSAAAAASASSSSTFSKHGLDDAAFGAAEGGAIATLRTFDAFPKTKASYTWTTSRGGQWTVALLIICLLLSGAELGTWWQGKETHHFSVERGVGHELQLNLDIVVAMHCDDIHINVQDAAMDRILAGTLLTKEKTNFALWTKKVQEEGKRDPAGAYQDVQSSSSSSSSSSAAAAAAPGSGNGDDKDRARRRRQREEEQDAHVGHVLGHMRSNPRRKFAKAPRMRRGLSADACRIYGSLEGNKVQGDFHITARGHGYMDVVSAPGGFLRPQQHLDHSRINFTHHINELSFGPHYPGLLNPLDRTSAHTEEHMYKFQYFVSVVPTIFTKRRVLASEGGGNVLDPAAVPQPPTLDMEPDSPSSKRDRNGAVHHHAHPQAGVDRQSIFTNQYAATSQSHVLSAADGAGQMTPGVFVKYDMEPIMLVVSEQRDGLLGLLVRLVNVVSGVLVGGGWAFQLVEWVAEGGVFGRRLRRRSLSNTYLGIGHRRANGSMDVKFGID